jgi:hypothetical protein
MGVPTGKARDQAAHQAISTEGQSGHGGRQFQAERYAMQSARSRHTQLARKLDIRMDVAN